MVSRKMWKVGRPSTTITTRSLLNNLRLRLVCRSRFWLHSARQRRLMSMGHEDGGEQPMEASSDASIVGTAAPAEETASGVTDQEQLIQEITDMVTAACSMDSCVASSSSSSGNVMVEEPVEVKAFISKKKASAKKLSCIEHFLNIRKEVNMHRKNMEPTKLVPPAGFEDYLVNRRTYALAGTESHSDDWSLIEPTVHPCTPEHLKPYVTNFIMDQHKERHKLRTQQLVERERLILSMEQEVIREHNRAGAGPAVKQTPPLSFCTILKDEEVYKPLRERRMNYEIKRKPNWCEYSKSFQAILVELQKKWNSIRESLLSRHRNEAYSLHAAQKMDLEWKLMKLDPSFPPASKSLYLDIPLVHVPDKF